VLTREQDRERYRVEAYLSEGEADPFTASLIWEILWPAPRTLYQVE
jgi:hypothetical protein